MGYIKGQIEFRKWKSGQRLTRKEAMLAQCFACNGEEESAVDCQGVKSCPMYAYAPYGIDKRTAKTTVSGKN